MQHRPAPSRIVSSLVLCFLLAARVSAQAAPWRTDNQPLTHAGIEHLARDTGYLGATSDEYNMRGETDLRNHLAVNGLEMIDFVNDKKTGMQALLLSDRYDKKKVYVVFRGTEANRLFEKEGWRDVAADTEGRIGKSQYENAKEKLDAWARKYDGRIVVTGHSLGGALVQQFIADHPDAVKEGVTFNAPGVDEATVAKVQGRDLPLTHYVVLEDMVSEHGGGPHLPGKVMAVAGENVEGILDAHSGTMLQPESDTAITEVDYWQWEKGRVERRKELQESGEVKTPDLADEPSLPEAQDEGPLTQVADEMLRQQQARREAEGRLEFDTLRTTEDARQKEMAGAQQVASAKQMVDQAGRAAHAVTEESATQSASAQSKESMGQVVAESLKEGFEAGAAAAASSMGQAVADQASSAVFGGAKKPAGSGGKGAGESPPGDSASAGGAAALAAVPSGGDGGGDGRTGAGSTPSGTQGASGPGASPGAGSGSGSQATNSMGAGVTTNWNIPKGMVVCEHCGGKYECPDPLYTGPRTYVVRCPHCGQLRRGSAMPK
ncbi:MAG: Mbeg1-like protein [Verrucomicrobiota bacterium]